jgi:2'-5' RNA ligase
LIEELYGKDLGFSNIIFETKGIGFFPNQKFPNVIFLELSEKERNSYKLAEEIENVVTKLGFERDKKFIPHVTLGRFRKGKRKRIDNIPLINAGDLKIEMDSFYLMKSMMSNKGSSYEKIKEFHFR